MSCLTSRAAPGAGSHQARGPTRPDSYATTTAQACSPPRDSHHRCRVESGREPAQVARPPRGGSTAGVVSSPGPVGSARVSRLLVLGDLHCDRRHLRGLIERAVEERCDALVSLGDLYYLPRDADGRRFLRTAGTLLRRAGLELLLVDGNHDDAEALADARARTPAPGPVPLGFRLYHLPAGTRFRLGRLRCLAYGGAFPARSPRAGRDWYRAAARRASRLGASCRRRRDRPALLPRPAHARARSAGARPLRQARGEAPPRPRPLRAPAPPARKRRRTARARWARLLPGRPGLGRRARRPRGSPGPSVRSATGRTLLNLKPPDPARQHSRSLRSRGAGSASRSEPGRRDRRFATTGAHAPATRRAQQVTKREGRLRHARERRARTFRFRRPSSRAWARS